MPKTEKVHSKEALEAAVKLMRDVFSWEDAMLLTAPGRGAVGSVAAALEAFAAERVGYVGPSNPLGYRRLCKDHAAVDYRHAWGCPECLVELRARNRALVAALTAARELPKLLGPHYKVLTGRGMDRINSRIRTVTAKIDAALAADAKAGEDR